MSSTSPDDPLNESSESASGYEDGLGRRVLGFDRETGGMLERLILRPELNAFEQALNERIPIVASLEDERFARPRAIEKDADDRLVVVSEYVAGRRLSDVIDAAAEYGIVAGIDAAFGALLDLLPAVSRIHDAGLVHGTLSPGRIIITPAGQLVLLDSIYGEPLERMRLTRKRLWAEFRLAFPSTAGQAQFDKSADLGHAAMVAATLTVGRVLQDGDYPDGIAILRKEIQEIASIRGSKGFAEAVDKLFASMLPLAGRKGAPASADEAAIDLRKLVRKELGINTCRTALLEFLQQVDAADAERVAAEGAERDRLRADAAAHVEAENQVRKAREETERKAREEAERKAREEAERQAREEAERKAREEAERKAREEAERAAREEAERKAREEAERKAREEAERKARDEAERAAREEAERKAREEAERKARDEAERKAREEAERKAREEAERAAREEADRKAREEAERLERERLEAVQLAAEARARAEEARREQERLEAEQRAREEADRRAREEEERKAREEAERVARQEAERKAREEAERVERERAEAERMATEARDRAEAARLEAELRAREEAERLAREQAERIAREEADRQAHEEAERKVRAEAERTEREAGWNAPPPPAPASLDIPAPAAESRPVKSGGWLVAPGRAASFAPPVPHEPPPAPAPPPTSIPLAGPRPYPIYVPPSEPAAWTADLAPGRAPDEEFVAPIAGHAAVPPITSILLAQPARQQAGIRLRDDGESGSAAAARGESRGEPIAEDVSAADVYGYTAPEDRQPIPWKLIAAGVVLIAGTFAITRGYVPSAAPVVETVKKVVPSKTVAAAAPAGGAVAGNVGRVVLTTQPPGARVTMDGKEAGETPLTIDGVKPGRHTFTLTGTDGSAKRTIRVDAGRILTLDVPLYPGFIALSIPIVVNVAENGKAIGTSDEQIILTPGKHELRVTNKELGYSTLETVEITSGEVTRLVLDPKGRANINAAPWAEVFIDGERAGETPLANVPIRLGVREIVFKNPQFPDRKQTVTVTANAPASVSVDFIK